MELTATLRASFAFTAILQLGGAGAQQFNLCASNGSLTQPLTSTIAISNPASLPSPPSCVNPPSVVAYAGSCFQQHGCSQDFNMVQNCFGSWFPQPYSGSGTLQPMQDCLCNNFLFNLAYNWQNCTMCMQIMGQGSGVNQTATELWQGADMTHDNFCQNTNVNNLNNFVAAWLPVAFTWSNFASGSNSSYHQPALTPQISLPTAMSSTMPSTSSAGATQAPPPSNSAHPTAGPSSNGEGSDKTAATGTSLGSHSGTGGAPPPTGTRFSWSAAHTIQPPGGMLMSLMLGYVAWLAA